MSKICTSIEQSQKLLELGIDVNTADMLWTYDFTVNAINGLNVISKYLQSEENDIPGWSLSALMNLLERTALFKTPQGWVCHAYIGQKVINSNNYYDNALDACYEIILKLKEKNLL